MKLVNFSPQQLLLEIKRSQEQRSRLPTNWFIHERERETKNVAGMESVSVSTLLQSFREFLHIKASEVTLQPIETKTRSEETLKSNVNTNNYHRSRHFRLFMQRMNAWKYLLSTSAHVAYVFFNLY